MSYITQLIERLGKALRPAKAAPAPLEAPATIHPPEPVQAPAEEPSVVEASVVRAIAGE